MIIATDKDFKNVIDNLDTNHRVSDMNENHQNISTHHTAKLAVFNRVKAPEELSGSHPKSTLEELDDSIFICTPAEHVKQRLNYIVIVSRILTEFVKCMKPFESEVIQHIRHQYSKEMRKKSENVSFNTKSNKKYKNELVNSLLPLKCIIGYEKYYTLIMLLSTNI